MCYFISCIEITVYEQLFFFCLGVSAEWLGVAVVAAATDLLLEGMFHLPTQDMWESWCACSILYV
jgi:hypothetical protein